MHHKFDELAKGLAQSVTRRQALKKFGVSLAGMALACFGLAKNANAKLSSRRRCVSQFTEAGDHYTGLCLDLDTCTYGADPSCTGKAQNTIFVPCFVGYVGQKGCSF